MVTNNSWNSEDPAQVAKGGTGLSSITDNNVIIGSGTSPVTPVAPSATSGVPLISQGAAVDPAFGTAVVAGGGTGATTLTGVLTGNGTSAVTANAITEHGVLIGGASNAVENLSVGATGTVLTGVTGADPAFTATPSVTSISFDGGSNTLSAYSTGSWTPGISFGGGTTGITYGIQSGKYTIVGNVVFYSFNISLTNKGSSTGAALITGLPATLTSPGPVGTIGLFSFITFTAGYDSPYFQAVAASTTLALGQSGNNAAAGALVDTNFANNSHIAGSGFSFI